MRKVDYEAKIARPLFYIKLLCVGLIIMNLFLPVARGDLGITIIGQWLVCVLVIYTTIGVHGGVGTLFFVKSQPLPVNLWVIIRFLEFLLIWLRFGMGSFERYFWVLLALDLLFILVVSRDYKKYSFEEGEIC